VLAFLLCAKLCVVRRVRMICVCVCENCVCSLTVYEPRRGRGFLEDTRHTMTHVDPVLAYLLLAAKQTELLNGLNYVLCGGAKPAAGRARLSERAR
jgi:hypothetical protein